MKRTFSFIFYLKRQVVKKDGTVPVMGRITVAGSQAQFSCKTTAQSRFVGQEIDFDMGYETNIPWIKAI